ncbi:hypothetical protein EDB89DRAFT_1909526 [Lactarius sanguifluus]|nr:hypothetical protein EDB89DRAFT_1909526 [Lactarius sanguifluus]
MPNASSARPAAGTSNHGRRPAGGVTAGVGGRRVLSIMCGAMAWRVVVSCAVLWHHGDGVGGFAHWVGKSHFFTDLGGFGLKKNRKFRATTLSTQKYEKPAGNPCHSLCAGGLAVAVSCAMLGVVVTGWWLQPWWGLCTCSMMAKWHGWGGDEQKKKNNKNQKTHSKSEVQVVEVVDGGRRGPRADAWRNGEAAVMRVEQEAEAELVVVLCVTTAWWGGIWSSHSGVVVVENLRG